MGGTCGCSSKQMGGTKQMGGNIKKKVTFGGNPVVVGKAWSPDNVNGNYYPLNNYKNDIQPAITSTGSQPPFSIGGKKYTRSRKRKTIHKKFNKRKRGNTENNCKD
jgi:hypothetical protein